MNTFDIIEYKKSSTIFVYGKASYEVFFVILDGNVLLENYLIENEKLILKKGDFLGLINAISNEPYFSTATSIDNVKLMAIKVKDLMKLNDNPMFDRIFQYLAKNLDLLSNMYLNMISRCFIEKNYEVEDLISIANYYKANEYDYVAKYMYEKYLEMFEGEEQSEYAQKMIDEIGVIKNIEFIENNIVEYKKGSCLFCEHEYNHNIYIIRSGKVGLYNVFQGYKIIQMIFVKGGVIGYRSILTYNRQTATAIIMEDSVVEKIGKDEFRSRLKTDNSFKYYLISCIAKRIWLLITKIESIGIKSYIGKLYNIIYFIAKSEFLIYNNQYYINIPYSIDELMDMVGILYEEKENVIKLISKNKYFKINNHNIILSDIHALEKDLVVYKR